MTFPGDVSMAKLEEVESLAKGGSCACSGEFSSSSGDLVRC